MKKFVTALILAACTLSVQAQSDIKTTIMDLSAQSSSIGSCIAHQHYLQTSQSEFPASKDFNRENVGAVETCNIDVAMINLETTKLLLVGVVSKENQASINDFLDNSRKIGYCDRIMTIENTFKTSENISKMEYFNSAVEKGVLSYLEISAQSQINDKCSEVFSEQRKLFATIREM